MTEKRYCIICGDEIHSNDPTADRCPKHGGPQPAQSPIPQQLEKAQQQGRDNSSHLPQKIEPWQPGKVILDTYEVKSKLGEGGFGQVYRVHHKGWNMDLAVKRPRPDKFKSEKQKQDFVREAETWVDLGLHPHITSCLYVRTIDDVPHVFAECVEGGSLESWIRQGKNGNLYVGDPKEVLERILDIAIQFSWGLGYAHEHEKLIHRDVKPDNALMTPEGILKVTDFGLARGKGLTPDGETQDPSGNIIVSGIAYSPYHCSPEQVGGTELSIKTDIWSWGVSVLEMFNGKITWLGGQIADGALESYLRRVGAPHIPPMPDTLAELLRECLQRHPDNRPADMLTITEKLMRIYQQEIGQAYPRQKPEPAELKADSLNNKALTMLDLGRPEQAEALLEQAVAADGLHVDATYNLGLLRWRSGRVTDVDVLQSLEQIQQDQSEDSGVVSALGWVCLESGRFGQALADFEHALRLGGDSYSEHGLALTRPLAVTGMGACLHTFEGHTSSVESVAFNPDKRQILSGSWDKTLKLWDLAKGECLRTFAGHTNPVFSVAFIPDERQILSGSNDMTLKLWDLANGECLRTYKGHKSSVKSIAISPVGRQALSGSIDETLKLWDLAKGECLRTFKVHTMDVNSVAISPDGHKALSGGLDDTLKLWDLAKGKCLRTFEGHKSTVKSVAFSPDGREILSGSWDKTLKLWDLAKGGCLRTFVGHKKSVGSITFSPDGRQALSGGLDDTLKLWDLAKGKCLRTFEGHTKAVYSVAISPDGRQALSGSKDKTLKLWDLAWFEENYYAAPMRYARGVTGSEADRLERTHTAHLQQARKMMKKGHINEALVYLGQARGVPGFERDIETLALCASVETRARITGFMGGWLTRTLEGHTDLVYSVAISPDGHHALSGGRDKTLKLWDLAKGECLRTFEGFVLSVAINPDGRQALFASGDLKFRMWYLSTGLGLRTFEGHIDLVSSVAFSPDGHQALSGSNDRTLKLWDLATGRCMRTFEGHTNWVDSVAFSPDGRQAFSGGRDKTLKLWDLVTGRCLHTFEGHTDLVYSVAISPDGHHVLSGSFDKRLKLWDLATGECLHTFEGHTSSVESVAFSPDGRKILSGSGDKTLKLWNTDTGCCLRTFEGHTDVVSSVAFSPDGRKILSGSWDHTLRLWDLDWEYEFPGWADWDEGARPYLANFLTLHTPYVSDLPRDREPKEEEIRRALTRSGVPTWTETDFQGLLTELGHRGYGWLRPEGVRQKLEEMAKERGDGA